MKVIFTTNIDKYKQVNWPELFEVPRKGEHIEVHPDYHTYCEHKRIPKRLEVCGVTYRIGNDKETYARVELWFNETDFKLYGGGEKLLA